MQMPVTTRAVQRRITHELLWAVLRLGRPLQLTLRDTLVCQAVCKALHAAASEHLTQLNYTGEDLLTRPWWRPHQLRSVTSAVLDVCALPQLGTLTALRSLHLPSLEYAVVNLQPLSSLRRLEDLHVASPASGVSSLPLLTRLQLNPCTAEDLQALGLQTRLEWLALEHYGCPNSTPQLSREHFKGVRSLSNLSHLELWAQHLAQLGGVTSLAACSSLQHVSLYLLECSCRDLGEDTGACSLASLTHLTSLLLGGAQCPTDFDRMGIDQLRSLQTLQLEFPWLDSGLVANSPHLRHVPCLELQFIQQDWNDVCQVITELNAVHLQRQDQGGANQLTVLRLSGWPSGPAPETALDTINHALGAFVMHGVCVESAKPGSSDPLKFEAWISAEEFASQGGSDTEM